MLRRLHPLLIGALLAHNGATQFVEEPTDLIAATGYAGIPVRYKQVPPGICELDPNVKSFSGYADVENDEHIFFWFFEARNMDPTRAPLTVWINGGPGASSSIGLFQEMGPCGVDYYGKVYNNPHSWTNVSNLLFIDQPTQVGFSYSKPIRGARSADGTITALPEGNNTCPLNSTCGTYSLPDPTLTQNSTANSAPNMWKTIQGFMGAFPQYSGNGFNFVSESYGGHYAPVFNEYILRQNAANIPGAKNIDLRSVLIGNGWFDPIIQYAAYYNFTVYPGNTYDFKPYNESSAAELHDKVYGPDNCVDRLKKFCGPDGTNNTACGEADSWCAQNVEMFLDSHADRDYNDFRYTSNDPFPYPFFVDYLNSERVLKAIGAFTNYTVVSSVVYQEYANTGDDGREMNTLEDVRTLLKNNVTVALYVGDADYNCNWLGVQEVAKVINPPGYSEAGFTNISTSDGITHGVVKQAGNFSFTRVYESGHEVPFYQPLLALEMFERVINGRDVATGETVPDECYKTKGPAESTFREGNSTVTWTDVPGNLTYDTGLNGPGAPWTQQSLQRRFKPTKLMR